jgi:hypothetical protein
MTELIDKNKLIAYMDAIAAMDHTPLMTVRFIDSLTALILHGEFDPAPTED